MTIIGLNVFKTVNAIAIWLSNSLCFFRCQKKQWPKKEIQDIKSRKDHWHDKKSNTLAW